MGCRVMSVLASDDQNLPQLRSIRALEAVLQAIQSQSVDGTVAIDACRALERLTQERASQALLADLGGIETVLRAMRTHLRDTVLQETCCKALLHRSTVDANRARI